MDNNRFTEADIADAALGQAHSEQERGVQNAAASDASLASAMTFWDGVAPMIDSERGQAKIANDDARARIMRHVTALPAATFEAPRKRWMPATMAALSMAAGLLLAAGYFVFSEKHASAPRPEARELASAFVRFDADASEGTGSALKPLATLAMGVQAVPAGGTVRIMAGKTPECLRIDKPVVLMAVDGRVQIGSKQDMKF